MSWYARTGPRTRHDGKFVSREKLGTTHHAGKEYRGWHYSFVAYQTSGTVRRKRYAASISDPQHNRVAYLRDCSSIEQATAAAQDWIDDALASIAAKTSNASLGTIPTLTLKTSPQSSSAHAK